MLSIGRSNEADYRINDISLSNSLPIEWELIHKGHAEILSGLFWGKHPILALSVAAAIGNELGIEGNMIREAVSEYRPLYGRGRIIYGSNSAKSGKILIDDAYNASPTSMLASISSFLDLDVKGSKWAVLGDMRELGDEESKFHKEISKLFAGIDKVLLIGELWKDVMSELPMQNCIHFENWQTAYKFISENSDWSAMLVKGSNSHKLQEIVAEIEKTHE
jgi:UDP-N-acetylmuramoyl-tripeptide--D-alanyl-D-alanine ligase